MAIYEKIFIDKKIFNSVNEKNFYKDHESKFYNCVQESLKTYQ